MNKLIYKKTAGSLIGLAICLLTSNTYAACDINAKVTRVLLNPNGGTIVFQRARGETFRFQGKSTRADIIALATAAQSGGTLLFVRGDASSCPASGNVRDVGNLTHLGTGF